MVCYTGYRKYLRLEKGVFSLDTQKVEAEVRYDGKFFLRTNPVAGYRSSPAIQAVAVGETVLQISEIDVGKPPHLSPRRSEHPGTYLLFLSGTTLTS